MGSSFLFVLVLELGVGLGVRSSQQSAVSCSSQAHQAPNQAAVLVTLIGLWQLADTHKQSGGDQKGPFQCLRIWSYILKIEKERKRETEKE